MKMSHGGHGLRVEGGSGTLIIPWEYTGVRPFLSLVDLVFILHAAALLVILFVPKVSAFFALE